MDVREHVRFMSYVNVEGTAQTLACSICPACSVYAEGWVGGGTEECKASGTSEREGG